jgi:glycosyltransferase involved in cell wall biosynthesis
MKICYFANSKGFHEKKWAEYFVKKGYDVSFISMDSSGNLSELEEMDETDNFDVPVRFLKNPILRVIYRLILSPFIARKFSKILGYINPDIIHAHSVQYGFFAAISTWRVPIVFTPMGSDVIIIAQKYFIYKLITKIAFKRARVITGDSLLLQNSGLKIGARKECNYIIQNGVDRTMFHPKVKKGLVREKYGISNKTKFVLSTRLFTKNYNIDQVIKSFSLVLESEPDSVLALIYGYRDENYYRYLLELLSKYLSNNFLDIGRVEYDKIPLYLAEADIFVSIPKSDSSPKSVYEAMACGTPCVVSDIPWTKNFLYNKQQAIVTSWNNEKKIANSILNIINDKKLSNHIVKTGKKFVSEKIDYHKNMAKMERIMLKQIRKIEKYD